ncbi:MAG TPA: Tim44/TimA family putative adaptor protein [Paracoccaceae bacterium]|nr:Tim44/TimA family putative adaptor protein [Paracoccaceae bacterium]
MIELLVLFALAAVVLYRLKTVIGTRTGHEAPPEFARRNQEPHRHGVPQPVPDIAPVPEEDGIPGTPENGRAAVEAIRSVEPGFSTAEFIAGARGAYEMILMAYEEGDRETLRALLAPDVFQAFEQGIAAREEAGLRVESRFIGVREAKADEVAFDPETRIADVTVKFVGELITAVRDAENRVVEGDPNEIRRQTDHWTFSREMGSADPNWLLTGTGD